MKAPNETETDICTSKTV